MLVTAPLRLQILISIFAIVSLISSNQLARAETNSEAIAETAWTPVIVQHTVSPGLFRGSDGKYNLCYELLLSNFSGYPTQVEELDVLDGSSGKTLLKLTGGGLAAVWAHANAPRAPVLRSSEIGLAFINLSFDEAKDAPNNLRHRVVVTSRNQLGRIRQYINDRNVVSVSKDEPVVVSPPLRGGRWVACGGYASSLGHRRSLFAVANEMVDSQRYAIDWLKLDEQGFLATGDVSKNENFPSYGEPVVAVADGTIVGVIDRFPDQQAGNPVGEERLGWPGGNQVIQSLGNGLFGFYAHLKPGSVKVTPGQKIKRGQLLGNVGNSGNSEAPHLHFHIMTTSTPLGGDGVPYYFDRFTINGTTDVAKLTATYRSPKPEPISASASQDWHRRELPKDGAIVSF